MVKTWIYEILLKKKKSESFLDETFTLCLCKFGPGSGLQNQKWSSDNIMY